MSLKTAAVKSITKYTLARARAHVRRTHWETLVPPIITTYASDALFGGGECFLHPLLLATNHLDLLVKFSLDFIELAVGIVATVAPFDALQSGFQRQIRLPQRFGQQSLGLVSLKSDKAADAQLV